MFGDVAVPVAAVWRAWPGRSVVRSLLVLAALAAAIGPRTRAIVLVNPNNPTGSFVKRHECGRLLDLASAHSLALLSDEVFADYAFASFTGVFIDIFNERFNARPWIAVTGKARERAAMTRILEIATTLGALLGASLAACMPTSVIAIIFGVVLLYSAYLSSRPLPEQLDGGPPDPLATRLRMNGHCPTTLGPQSYRVHRVPLGFSLMALAGVLSGLLGIGSGAVKVLAMDQVMRIPFKVSTTTSNFMIGVTAAASAGVYLNRGYIDPGLSMPVMLGVLVGSLLGARVLVRARTRLLRTTFALVIVALGFQMIYNGLTGRL